VIVISDTSPITNLAAIGCLDLLRQLYHRVIIPSAVYRELTAETGRHPGAMVQTLDWIETGAVTNQAIVTALRIELDEGEAEAIALAQELNADLVLIDERLGRAAASRFGLRVLGLLGVLIQAKQQGLIPEIKPLLDGLQHAGFYITRICMLVCFRPQASNL
jgi:predicted nucleic acid-binding protein